MKSGRFLSGVAVLAVLLPGCAALPGGGPAPLDTYELSAASTDNALRRTRTQILIAEPSALKSLDGQNIVIKPSPGVIQYLKGAQWADRLPRVVQARLAETFQRSGFTGVGRPGEGLAIDYQIIVDVRAFEVRVGNGGTRANVELFVRVLNDRNGVIKSSKVFSASAPVSGTGNDAYVGALDRAFGQTASDIVGWAASVI